MDERPTTAELLTAWRDATRAADLAERLARMAAEAAEQADRNAAASEEIAQMAEEAATSAERAATTARLAAKQATMLARTHREQRVPDADAAVTSSRETEAEARHAYHDAEASARDRHTEQGRA